MKVLVEKFLSQPVAALGFLVTVATGLTAEGIISGPVAVTVVVVLTAAQWSLVTPARV